MRQRDYDNPYNQQVGAADTPEARRWDKRWEDVDQNRWDHDRPFFPQFLDSLREISSILAEDRRYWNLSAKHVYINLSRDYREGILEPRQSQGDAFDPGLSGLDVSDLDWEWLTKLVLNAVLVPVGEWKRRRKTDPKETDLSRFDELRALADRTDDVFTFAEFLGRARELFWHDEVVEQVNVKRFVDELISILEDPSRDPGEPVLEPAWGWVEAILRSAIKWGNTTVW